MEWREINNFPDYLINNYGQVKSKQRKVKRLLFDKTVNERILKQSTRNGYAFVTLRKNNSHKANMIHHMVAEAFIGERPIGLIVHHKDGNKLNNESVNLEYTSKQKNTKHYYNSIGKSMGKVPISEVVSIISRIDNGEECQKIAKEYNVTRNDIAVLCKILSL